MKHLLKHIALLVLLCLQSSSAKDVSPIAEYRLDEHTVYAIPVSRSRVTTISFPGPISAIDAANVTSDPKIPGLFQIAHTKGSYFLSVRALVERAMTNMNIRWNKKTYVIELVESPSPFYSVIFQYDTDADIRPASARVTPSRLLALLDKAKAYPLLKEYHANAVDQVEYVNFSKNPRVLDYRDYEVQLDEVFRFNPEDTLIFRMLLRNKTDQSIQYRPDGFSLRVGERTYPQSISDASGTIPPKGQAPAYFAVTGTPNGGRNDLSLKNDFTVLLDRVETNTAPLQWYNPNRNRQNEPAQCHHILAQPDRHTPVLRCPADLRDCIRQRVLRPQQGQAQDCCHTNASRENKQNIPGTSDNPARDGSLQTASHRFRRNVSAINGHAAAADQRP